MGHDHSHDAETVSEEKHTNSWSANLELSEHDGNEDLVVSEAIEAVSRTASGYHVNLVTHESLGHPSDYLYDVLTEEFGDSVEFEFVDQCGCGGYVTKVEVEDTEE